MSLLAFIPARGGSKGLPGKNIRPIAGTPLIAWSIRQALACPGVARVVVSTDDPRIAAVATEHGADVPFLRPAELARDDTATEPVMLHALDALRDQGASFDAIMLLQPTSPIRLPGSVEAAIATFDQGFDSLLTVNENHHFFWRDPAKPEALYDYRNRPRRQDIRPEDRWFRENGSIYLTRVEQFRQTGNRLCGRIGMHVMKEEEGIEIDSAIDFAMAEAVLKELQR